MGHSLRKWGSSKLYFAPRYLHFSQERMGHSLKKGADAPYMGRPIKNVAFWEPSRGPIYPEAMSKWRYLTASSQGWLISPTVEILNIAPAVEMPRYMTVLSKKGLRKLIAN